MKTLKYSSLIICSLLFFACGGGDAATTAAEEVVNEVFPADIINTIDEAGRANLSESQQSLHKYLKDTNQGLKTEPVAAVETLLGLFPKSIDGLDVYDEGGEISNSLGAPATLTKVTFRKERQVARVNLIDTGGHPAVLMGVAAWSLQAINKENENYSEQTRTFRGFPAYQHWQPSVMHSRFEYVIDQRFVVSIQGKNIDMARVEKIAKFLSPAKLRKAVK